MYESDAVMSLCVCTDRGFQATAERHDKALTDMSRQVQQRQQAATAAGNVALFEGDLRKVEAEVGATVAKVQVCVYVYVSACVCASLSCLRAYVRVSAAGCAIYFEVQEKNRARGRVFRGKVQACALRV